MAFLVHMMALQMIDVKVPLPNIAAGEGCLLRCMCTLRLQAPLEVEVGARRALVVDESPRTCDGTRV